MAKDDLIDYGQDGTCEYIRRKNGLSQQQLADLLGITRRTYTTRALSDNPKWQFDELVKLAEIGKSKKIVAKSQGIDYEITIRGLKKIA